jgi:hypothetical protein
MRHPKYKRSMLWIAMLTIAIAPLFVSRVLALPIDYFATTTCIMADGSQGVLQSDGRTCCPSNDQNQADPSEDTDCLFTKYIDPVIQLFSAAVGLAVVIAVIIGGIEYTSSAGDPQRSAAGQKHITNALLGLFAYALFYVFLQFLIPGGFLHG